ncbi:unnamed protein product [Rhodiola kirilowii]
MASAGFREFTENDIKTMTNNFSSMLSQGVLKEVRMLQIFSKHENIVNFYGHGTGAMNTKGYLVMERLRISLTDIVECNSVEVSQWKDLISVIIQIAEGLKYIHDKDTMGGKRYIYMNMKLDNIMLSKIDQVCTQRSWKRPYGVGLLNANSRPFTGASRDDLIRDALFAIRETLQGEKLSSSICTVAVLGVDEAFKTLDQTAIQSFIDAFEIVEEEPAAEQEPATEEPAAPAEGVGQGGHLISHETKFHLFHVFIQNLDHLSDNCHDLVAILNRAQSLLNGERAVVVLFVSRIVLCADSSILYESLALVMLALYALAVEICAEAPGPVSSLKTRPGASCGVLLGAITLPAVLASKLIQQSRGYLLREIELEGEALLVTSGLVHCFGDMVACTVAEICRRLISPGLVSAQFGINRSEISTIIQKVYCRIVRFVFSEPLKRLSLCFYWVSLICVAVLRFYSISKHSKVERILLRKYYHLMAVCMFLPAVIYQPMFLDLAFGAAMAVFLVLEIIRIWRMWPLGQLVHQFMNAFTDHRDSDILIVSHFSLLLGCALPIWMSSGYNDRPLAPFAGILSLGIGDTMASMVGYKYGVLRWSKAGKKTIEGTAAGITSMLAACLTLLPLLASTGYLVTENWFPLLFAVTVSGLLEAYTAQLDNAFIPLPIRNIELMNDAMMLNQLWELSKEGQSLWIKWVEVWIGEGAGFNVNDTYLTLKSREEEVDWHSLVWNRFNTPSASFYA